MPRVPAALQTERLLLRTWRDDDRAAFAALNADPAVMRWVGGRQPLSRAQSDALLGRIEAHWDEHGFGVWAVQRRDAHAAGIGFAGLAVPSFLPEILPAVEVGWRLPSAWWGRGLATEGARAAVACAWGPLGLGRVVAVVHPANAASLRVAQKLGMRPGRDRLLPQTRERVRVLELDAPAGALDSEA